jgi:hypothetical protein
MKKYISILFFAGLVLNLCAQEVATQTDETAEKLVSKKGIAILPEKGEFSFGIDASPILSYLGSLMSSGGSGSPYMAVPDESYTYGISGKYMLSNKTALRANLYTEVSTYKYLYSVRKSELTPNELAPQYVEDAQTSNYQEVMLSFGIEKRRGKSRIQGIYGADLLFGVDKSKTTYEYGNPITVEFNTPAIYLNSYGSNGERLIEATSNNYFTVGARGFIGVEFFVGPKLSLGGELGYTLRYRTQSNTQNTYEYWNTENLQVEEIVRNVDYKGYSSIGLLTNTSASLKLNFYF